MARFGQLDDIATRLRRLEKSVSERIAPGSTSK
jgi:hypothetical protein